MVTVALCGWSRKGPAWTIPALSDGDTCATPAQNTGLIIVLLFLAVVMLCVIRVVLPALVPMVGLILLLFRTLTLLLVVLLLLCVGLLAETCEATPEDPAHPASRSSQLGRSAPHSGNFGRDPEVLAITIARQRGARYANGNSLQRTHT